MRQHLPRKCVELNIKVIQSSNLLHLDVSQAFKSLGCNGLTVLGKLDIEAHVESLLEDMLGLGLHFRHSKECHPQQILLGTLEHDPLSLLPRHGSGVIAMDELEVGQHPRLSVDGLSVKT